MCCRCYTVYDISYTTLVKKLPFSGRLAAYFRVQVEHELGISSNCEALSVRNIESLVSLYESVVSMTH